VIQIAFLHVWKHVIFYQCPVKVKTSKNNDILYYEVNKQQSLYPKPLGSSSFRKDPTIFLRKIQLSFPCGHRQA